MKLNCKKRYLLLADGTVYEGKAFGADGETVGEVVFTTNMTGYLETLTDPSYYGQIVVQTFPLIGNYGVIPPDKESGKPQLRGYIVREWCEFPSNFRCEGDIDTFLKVNNIIGLWDIDTRSLTRKIRSYGVMNGAIVETKEAITDELKNKLQGITVREAVSSVSPQPPVKTEVSVPRFKVALWDLGAKANIERELRSHGCEVVRVSCQATADDIAKLNVDGVLISNGPGDPVDNPFVIEQVGLWLE
ncbi:MAG: carbamoyl phosphate synthase small subunit, partial [Bacillota bacterium]|nr:carbamoyl phosphate synthase small subunit [Bacillota bacterium]